ncbi:ABC transporter ATP-binding protein [Ferrovibrio sp.]|uniref:ABC transporter ATP-binding protein n=1 Tax=Ferrovibrio sp. TaxID=1917215 RepID=UPI0035B4318C
MAHIKLTNVNIDFPVYDHDRVLRKTVWRRSVGGLLQRGSQEERYTVRALRGINLELQDGDRLALMGHNGAGKTTLLQVLSGIYEPPQGQVEIAGKVSSLLNTNLGMDGDDTGYNNIWSSGLVLGMTPAEIRAKLDAIAEFSELGQFLALPVRTYSAGMTMRLAFSIATAIEPEVLLLDEGIGAGDAGFQTKAEARIDELMARTSILVLASHNPQLLAEMCNKAVILRFGRIVATGSVSEMQMLYNEMNAAGVGAAPSVETIDE